MYYAVDLFVKKGPLGKLWLAGTCFTKLTKKVIITSDIPKMCNDIVNPPVSLALRASSTLFKGIVRIENKKAMYLQGDALDARSRLHTADLSKINLPRGKEKAKNDSITYNLDTSTDDLLSISHLDIDPFLLDESLSTIDPKDGRALRANLRDISLPSISYSDSMMNSYLDIDLLSDSAMTGELSLHSGDPSLLDVAFFDDQIDFNGDSYSRDGGEFIPDFDEIPTPDAASAAKTPPRTITAADVTGTSSPGSVSAIVLDESSSSRLNVSDQRKKRRTAKNVIKMDEFTELSKQAVKEALDDTSDIITKRPLQKSPEISAFARIHQPCAPLQNCAKALKSLFSNLDPGYALTSDSVLDASGFPVPGTVRRKRRAQQPDEQSVSGISLKSMGAEGASVLDEPSAAPFQLHSFSNDGDDAALEYAQPSLFDDDYEAVMPDGDNPYADADDRKSVQRLRDARSETGSVASLERLRAGDESVTSDTRSNAYFLGESVDDDMWMATQDARRRSSAAGRLSLSSRGSLQYEQFSPASTPGPSPSQFGTQAFNSPNIDSQLPYSQFDIPTETVSAAKPRPSTVESDGEHLVTRHTRIFKQKLEDLFEGMSVDDPAVSLDTLVIRNVKNAGREAYALAFYELLKLSSLGVVSVKQDKPYATLMMSKGAYWDRTWREAVAGSEPEAAQEMDEEEAVPMAGAEQPAN